MEIKVGDWVSVRVGYNTPPKGCVELIENGNVLVYFFGWRGGHGGRGGGTYGYYWFFSPSIELSVDESYSVQQILNKYEHNHETT